MKRISNYVTLSAAAIVAALVIHGSPVAAQTSANSERGAIALGSVLDGLGNTSRVLLIGAHPDDEDTQLIAWLARGRHVETAYLSLTRGDGGQNLIGNELGEALGVIRTQELLAARRVDGARQYFSRAFDFGFSKNAEETLKHWPKDTVLGDVVRVVRAFRPQVIIAVFTGTPRDGHGHHQVSGMLAREAYGVSGDTIKYPTATFGPTWTVSKIYQTQRFDPSQQTLSMNIGEYSPLLGRSYSEIAVDSRSQHRSQGFGALQRKGAFMDYVRREQSRVASPEKASDERSVFDGVDTTWARLRTLTARRDVQLALDSASLAFGEVRNLYRAGDPSPIVAPLARAVRLLRAARDSSGSRPPVLFSARPGPDARTANVDALVQQSTIRGTAFGARDFAASSQVAGKPPANSELWNAIETNLQRAEDALLQAAGIAVEATAQRGIVPLAEASKDTVPDTLGVAISVYNRGRTPISIRAVSVNSALRDTTPILVRADSTATINRVTKLVDATAPWWRTLPRQGDWFRTSIDSRDDAEREAANGVPLAVARIEIAGVTVDAGAQVINRYADPVKGDQQVAVVGVPGITITLDHAVEYIRAGVPVTRTLRVNVVSAYPSSQRVNVSLKLPKGLTADSSERTRVLTPGIPNATLLFNLKGTLPPGKHELSAVATHEGTESKTGYTTIAYEHITTERMYAASNMSLSAVSVTMPPRARVAYVQGVGDNGMDALQQLDIAVEKIDPAAIATTDLSKYSSVIVGPRAYSASDVLVANNARLLDYAKKGGTLVVQYGQTEMMRPGIMPYPITLSRTAERVTIEEAPVTITAPQARVLTTPNKITDADWDGWVQERATYMPSTFDSRYASVLQMNDPGEPVNKAGLLVAPVGKGTYVYVTLALFRQLPAGVPGAAHLLLNIISATPAPSATPRMEE